MREKFEMIKLVIQVIQVIMMIIRYGPVIVKWIRGQIKMRR